MTSRRLLGTVALGAASVLALAGCAGSGSDADSSGASDDGVITVVASIMVFAVVTLGFVATYAQRLQARQLENSKI